MSKTKSESPAIEVGKPIILEDSSRKGLAKQIGELVADALKQGLKPQGGFIEFDGVRFSASVTLNKP